MNGFIIKDGSKNPNAAWREYAEELESDVEALVVALASERKVREELEARLARLKPRPVAG